MGARLYTISRPRSCPDLEIWHTYPLARYTQRTGPMTTETREFTLEPFIKTAASSELLRKHDQRFDADRLGLASRKNLPGMISAIVGFGDAATTARVETARRAAEHLALPAPKRVAPVLTTRHASGVRFNLDRVLGGDPLPFDRWERSHVRAGSRVISLSVPIGGRSRYSAAEIGWAPVSAIVIADLLENAGYRVEMWGISRAECGYGREVSLRCPLKAADAPLDVNAISRIAHPAIFRGLILAIRHREFHDIGGTIDIDPKAHGDADGFALQHTYSFEAAIEQVKSTITKFQ